MWWVAHLPRQNCSDEIRYHNVTDTPIYFESVLPSAYPERLKTQSKSHSLLNTRTQNQHFFRMKVSRFHTQPELQPITSFPLR